MIQNRRLIVTLTIILNITPSFARGEVGCEKIEEYQHVIQNIQEDINVLEQARQKILTGGENPRSETYEVEPSVIQKSGSQLLREQEELMNSLEDINQEKEDALKHIGMTSAFIPIVGYFTYRTWKPPFETRKVFLEILFNDHPLHLVAKTMLGIFLVHLTSKTTYHGVEYYSLTQESQEAKLKMETLGTLADIEDTIAAKKRVAENLDIHLELLTEHCSHDLQ